MTSKMARPALRTFGRAFALAAKTAGHLALLELESTRGQDRRAILHRRVGLWATSMLAVCGLDVLADGPYVGHGEAYAGRDAHGRGRMFVLNHRSALDIFVALSCLEAHLVSRADLGGWPLIGKSASRIGTLFVDRENAASGAAVIGKMTRAMREGSAIALFPEGTAFAGDAIRPLHPGAFAAALRVGAELVPVGLAYEDPRTAYGDESFGAHMGRVLGLERGRVALAAGEPIPTKGSSITKLKDNATTALEGLVARARLRLSFSA